MFKLLSDSEEVVEFCRAAADTGVSDTWRRCPVLQFLAWLICAPLGWGGAHRTETALVAPR